MTTPVSTPEPRPIGVNDHTIAKALGLSLGWVRADRLDKRLIPFYRLGGAIRYNVDRVREALLRLEEGGGRPPKPRPGRPRRKPADHSERPQAGKTPDEQ